MNDTNSQSPKGLETICKTLADARTTVLFCEQFDETSSIWNFESHKHDCIELLYFLFGNAEVTCDEKIVQASFYDMVIYPPHLYHTELLQYNHHQEVICIWVDIPGLEFEETIHIQDKDSSVKWLLEQIQAEYKRENRSDTMLEYYVKTTAMTIAKRSLEDSVKDDPLSRVMTYMQHHMAENITVEELADLIYVSKSYLSRHFKQETGMSLIEYLRLVRINAAKRLLVSTDTTIEEISSIIGYNSSKYFSRAFKTCTGMAPSDFKKHEDRRMQTRDLHSVDECINEGVALHS